MARPSTLSAVLGMASSNLLALSLSETAMTQAAEDRHKAKMAKRKAAEVAAKPILAKGLLIVHTPRQGQAGP